MKVRKAEIDDLSALVEFTAREAEESEGVRHETHQLERGIRTALEDPSIARYWVLISDSNHPIGSISSLREWSDWNAGYYWWIQSMYIVPGHRGKGHIQRLVEAVKTEMERENGLELRLYVHHENDRAIQAYRKIGFDDSLYKIMVHK